MKYEDETRKQKENEMKKIEMKKGNKMCIERKKEK